jgi:uncharacterized protein
LFRAIEADGSAPALTLVMGPWSHGQWSRGGAEKLGDLNFASKTGEYFREQIEFPFFMHALKDQGDGKLPKAWMFETGKNEWRKFEAWPPTNAAAAPCILTPAANFPSRLRQAPEQFDEYTSDPAKPVPVT